MVTNCIACNEQISKEYIEHYYHRMVIQCQQMRDEAFRLGNRTNEKHFLQQRDIFIRKKNDLYNQALSEPQIKHTCKK